MAPKQFPASVCIRRDSEPQPHTTIEQHPVDGLEYWMVPLHCQAVPCSTPQESGSFQLPLPAGFGRCHEVVAVPHQQRSGRTASSLQSRDQRWPGCPSASTACWITAPPSAGSSTAQPADDRRPASVPSYTGRSFVLWAANPARGCSPVVRSRIRMEVLQPEQRPAHPHPGMRLCTVSLGRTAGCAEFMAAMLPGPRSLPAWHPAAAQGALPNR